jgi:hypothetical protein
MGIKDLFRRQRDPFVYPLNRSNERSFPDGYEGDLFVWDIDKTYLATNFKSIRGLLSIPLEMAIDKRAIPGADTLLRALRRGVHGPTGTNPLYFVSGSPSQLRGVIQRKMLLDGVEYDGITFKDHARLIRMGRVQALTQQIPYKLSALLANRRELPWGLREHLFGDDSESDALIYALYGDVVAGRLRGATLRNTLTHNGVEGDMADHIVTLADDLDASELVAQIFIHLTEGSAPEAFDLYGPRLLACTDTLQMATRLFETERLPIRAVVDVGRALQKEGGPSAERSLTALAQRGRVTPRTLDRLWPELTRAGLVKPQSAPPSPNSSPPELDAYLTPATRRTF